MIYSTLPTPATSTQTRYRNISYSYSTLLTIFFVGILILSTHNFPALPHSILTLPVSQLAQEDVRVQGVSKPLSGSKGLRFQALSEPGLMTSPTSLTLQMVSKQQKYTTQSQRFPSTSSITRQPFRQASQLDPKLLSQNVEFKSAKAFATNLTVNGRSNENGEKDINNTQTKRMIIVSAGNNINSSTTTNGVNRPPNGLYPCHHIILFSAARHGSTWFVDCVENCTFTDANNGTFGKLNSATELWDRGQNRPGSFMSTDDAVNYVRFNMSVKIFPAAFKQQPHVISGFIKRNRKLGTPFVVLTRRIDASYRSYTTAIRASVWNRNSHGEVRNQPVTVREAANISVESWNSYNTRIPNYFKEVTRALDANGVTYDTIDYDDIKKAEWIMLPKNNCYIRNCNFRTRSKEKSSFDKGETI